MMYCKVADFNLLYNFLVDHFFLKWLQKQLEAPEVKVPFFSTTKTKSSWNSCKPSSSTCRNTLPAPSGTSLTSPLHWLIKDPGSNFKFGSGERRCSTLSSLSFRQFWWPFWVWLCSFCRLILVSFLIFYLYFYFFFQSIWRNFFEKFLELKKMLIFMTKNKFYWNWNFFNFFWNWKFVRTNQKN